MYKKSCEHKLSFTFLFWVAAISPFLVAFCQLAFLTKSGENEGRLYKFTSKKVPRSTIIECVSKMII